MQLSCKKIPGFFSDFSLFLLLIWTKAKPAGFHTNQKKIADFTLDG